LGQWLAANSADLGYIPDEIEPSVAYPLLGAEVADLYRLARTLDPADCTQARLQRPPQNNSQHQRNWRRPPPSCATYVTASPRRRAWLRTALRWKAWARTVFPP
jgi:hypothetical protein